MVKIDIRQKDGRIKTIFSHFWKKKIKDYEDISKYTWRIGCDCVGDTKLYSKDDIDSRSPSISFLLEIE